MHINKIDHLCIAVKDLEEAKKRWAPILGTEPDDEYVHEGEQIRVARYILGGVGFELMESTSPEGEVAQWIEKRGEGLMLVSLNVDSTAEAVSELEEQDYPIIGGLRQFRDCEFAFVHPKSVNGVLLELIDDKWER
jgi:methylmalonyl-CoA/ethylmalonyl-CoA epimerase